MAEMSMVSQMAYNGAKRVQAGEIPKLKNARNLSKLHGEQNIDFFESSFKELQKRDNADGEVSMHVYTAGPDQDDTPGRLKVGELDAQFQGTTEDGARFSIEHFGEKEKIKYHKFEDSKVIVYEATIQPEKEEMTTSVLVLDRENPEESLIGSATAMWLLGRE